MQSSYYNLCLEILLRMLGGKQASWSVNYSEDEDAVTRLSSKTNHFLAWVTQNGFSVLIRYYAHDTFKNELGICWQTI